MSDCKASLFFHAEFLLSNRAHIAADFLWRSQSCFQDIFYHHKETTGPEAMAFRNTILHPTPVERLQFQVSGKLRQGDYWVQSHFKTKGKFQATRDNLARPCVSKQQVKRGLVHLDGRALAWQAQVLGSILKQTHPAFWSLSSINFHPEEEPLASLAESINRISIKRMFLKVQF